ncbi:MAG TPA: hypothetical protein VES93_09875, partial [Ornithinibacter sp.]|nr:hypothetical protein [Ornithinibacter sp.]
PWPHGPTRASNLICLCRRHHRIKQRHRWHLTLTPDGIATFTDPTGKVRTTHPADALHTTVLPDVTRPPSTPAGTTTPAASTSRARTALPEGPHSELEFLLEHLAAAAPGRTPTPVTTWRDQHGRHRIEILPRQGLTLLAPAQHWPCQRT